MVTNFINHSFTYSIKRAAAKRGLPVIYATTNSKKLQVKMLELAGEVLSDNACRKTLFVTQQMLYFIFKKVVNGLGFTEIKLSV